MYSNRRKETSFDNGIIYPIVFMSIYILKKLNIVECLKALSDFIADKMYKTNSQRLRELKKRKFRNVTIDLFIIFKNGFVIILMIYGYRSWIILIIVIYLLISNVFTYFYYHLWCDDALYEEYQTIHRVRRRFISLFASIIFMVLCYAYLYSVNIPDYFLVIDSNNSEIVMSIYKSLSQSFTIDYESITAKNSNGFLIELSQTINSFIFITILLAKSLPKAMKIGGN